MATVPRAQRQAQIAPGRPVFQNRQSIQTPGAAFGVGQVGLEGLSGGLQQASDAAARIALDRKAKETSRAAKQAEIAYERRLRELGYGTAGNPGGYYTSRGQDAVDARPGFEEAAQKARQEILDGVGPGNDQLLERIGVATGARLERELSSSARFHERESRVADQSTAQARIDNASNSASQRIMGPTGMEDVMVEVTVASNEADELADIEGAGSDRRIELRTAAQTQVVRAAFDRAVGENPLLAEQIFDRFQNVIDGRVHDEMLADLKVGKLRQQSLVEATNLGAEFGGLTEQLDAAKDRFGDQAELHDAIVKRLRFNATVKKQAEKQAQENLDKSVWNHALEGGDPNDLPPSVQRAASRVEMQAAIKHYEDELQGEGFAKVSNAAILNELETSGQGLASINLLQARYMRNLTRGDWQRISSKQQTMLSSDSSEQSAFRSIDQQRTGAATQLGLKGRKKEEFLRVLDEDAQRFHADNGRWPDREEYAERIKLHSTEFTSLLGGGLFSRGETDEFRDLTPDQRLQIDLSERVNLPADERDDAELGALLNVPESVMPTILRAHPAGRPNTVEGYQQTIEEIRSQRGPR